MTSFWQDLIEVGPLSDWWNPASMVFLCVSLGILLVARWGFARLCGYQLNKELFEQDNKAVALSFTGYMFGVSLILYTLLQTDSYLNADSSQMTLLVESASLLMWGAIAIAMLMVGGYINDKVILGHFSNVKELVKDRNLGTGAVECGGFIGTALVLQGNLSGEAVSLKMALVGATFFFVVGQCTFVLYGWLYQRILSYDFRAEIEQDNVAAGVSLGLNLVANGILLSTFLAQSSSLVGLVIWLLISWFMLLASRFAVDAIMLPGGSLDEEVARDRNWGTALLEGGVVVGLALIVSVVFF